MSTARLMPFFAALFSVTVLAAQEVPTQTDPFHLQKTVEVYTQNPTQIVTSEIFDESIMRLEPDFGPFKENGVVMRAIIEWKYEKNDPHELEELMVRYHTVPSTVFSGEFAMARKDLWRIGKPAMVPMHSQLADLAARELDDRWHDYKKRAEMFARGLQGAPKP